jgi:GT2 family glycosyltransferase
MPVYNTPRAFLRQAVESVQAQLYTHWELCIADDASPEPEVFALLQELAAADDRIKIMRREVNGHISASSNSALALATGDFVALMDHDDVLAEHALFEVVAALNDNRDLDLIYSDEDHIDQHGRRNNAYFKSDFNIDLLLGQNMISHLGVYRRSLLEQVGGFRLGLEGSQDYDLALRVVDATVPARIHHIPAVLYHWRSNTGQATFSEEFMQRCLDTARRALTDHLARRGQRGVVLEHPKVPSWQRVKRAVPDPAPLVSVIVPTKDKPEILRPCIEGILHRTDYQNLQVIIVDHQSTDPAALDLLARLAEDPRVEIMPYEGPFNYSAINNAAVKRARGTLLALLNNDVDVINPEWLDEMVALAALPEVGAVGAKLFYPDGRVQHAGVLLGAGGVAGHYFHLFDASDPGYFGRAVMTSSVAAVTAACLVVRRSVFDEVGGFDEVNLPVAFNDVDLCLKIGEAGYRNVWTPHAQLTHYESLSRGSDEVGERHERFKREVEFMMQKWDGLLASDFSYNPNLALPGCAFALSFPPRRRKPWKHEGA